MYLSRRFVVLKTGNSKWLASHSRDCVNVKKYFLTHIHTLCGKLYSFLCFGRCVIVLQLSLTSLAAKMADITQRPWLLVDIRYLKIIGSANGGRAPIVVISWYWFAVVFDGDNLTVQHPLVNQTASIHHQTYVVQSGVIAGIFKLPVSTPLGRYHLDNLSALQAYDIVHLT